MAHGDPLVATVQRGAVSSARARQRSSQGRNAPASPEDEAAAAAFAARLQYQFTRPGLLVEALTHRSAADPGRDLLDSNERLEFLGDRVLALVTAEWLVERFPEEREGALGKRLGALVSADSLAKIAEAMGLGAALRLPPGEKRAGLATRASVLADALEATLGALYLDGGLEPARALVRREFESLLSASHRPPVSPKTRLQEWTLGRGLGLPEYVLASASGPPHAPVFVVRVTAAGREAEGSGETKRAAEQTAAERLLALLGVT